MRVVREFNFFDGATISAELAKLPVRDRARLIAVMEHYEQVGHTDPGPAVIDGYGGGIMRIRHARQACQGRALFYVAASEPNRQDLIVLTVYKKESRRTPVAVLSRARMRMELHKDRK